MAAGMLSTFPPQLSGKGNGTLGTFPLAMPLIGGTQNLSRSQLVSDGLHTFLAKLLMAVPVLVMGLMPSQVLHGWCN